jgi:hypothetical protein
MPEFSGTPTTTSQKPSPSTSPAPSTAAPKCSVSGSHP